MKKRLIYILSIAIAIPLLYACTKQPAVSPSGATNAPTGSTEKVKLRLWSHVNNAFNAGYDALITAYETAHPNVTIERESFDYDLYLQTLQSAMPAGQEADILQMFGTWTAQYYERLAPLPESVMTLSDAKQLFYKAPLGGFIINGKLYGLPEEFNNEYGGVLVNKSMFAAAGLAFPPQWKTMDDVVADGLKLTKKDASGLMTVAGFHFTNRDAIGFFFLAGIKQRGGNYWNTDQTNFTFNTPEAKAQLQWMDNAVKQGVVDPKVFNDDDTVGRLPDSFFTSKVAIGYIGAWAVAEGKANYPDFHDEWDYVYLPPIQGTPVFVADSGWGLSVSPHSKHQDIAWDFVKFATSNPANALQWNIASGTIPAIPEVAKNPMIAEKEPWVARGLDILPFGEYLGNMPDRDLIMYQIIYPHILEALEGVKTIDETLQAIDTEANSTFKK
jgi:multiple sugar transport system substrate-binding protein